ncbi:MAG: hypothetical protein FJ125_13225, partial [Deltaproteobacteria bacterium]|nr:hypothetical protein [Deltaproteobacteria bacterium]
MARAGQMAASGGPPGRADRPCGVRTSRRAGPPLLPALLLPLLLLLLLLLLLCCAASCDADGEVDPASRPGPASDGGEASRTDGGERETGSDGAGPDCFPTAGGSERCDGLDNDCNGVVDDVAEGNAQLIS